MNEQFLGKRAVAFITIAIFLLSFLQSCILVEEESLPLSHTMPTSKISFHSFLDGDSEIYAMILPAGELVKLTDNSAFDGYATWSPDGRQITFISDRDGDYEIYKMNADGSNQTRLTYSVGEDAYPSWSPDGKHIAFSSMQNGNCHIWVMDSDAGNQHPLTQGGDVH